ncbi:unnamed protein product, partial [Meganyctiphanes norvegica]
KKSSHERRHGGGKSKEKGPGKHSHERRRHSHEHKHKHIHEHRRPRPKPGKHSKERTTAMMAETTTASTTMSTTTVSSTTPPTTTTSTSTLSTTTPSTTTPSTTTPSTTTPSTTTPSTTTPSTTPSTTLSTTTASSTTPSTTTPMPTLSSSLPTTASETPEPTTPGCENASIPPELRKRRSPTILSLSNNEDIYSGGSEHKKHNKHEIKHAKPGKQSPGKHSKEYANTKQHGTKRKSSSEEALGILNKSNILHPYTDNSKPNQNKITLQNEFKTDHNNFTSLERSSEELNNGIEVTTAGLTDQVTQMPDSDEINSIEDFSTEDYDDILTTESPLSIENDSKSAEDVDVTTEEPDEIISNESYDYYSDE